MSDFEELERIAETVGGTGTPRSAKQRAQTLKVMHNAGRRWNEAKSFYGRVSPYEPSLPKLKFMEDTNKT